MDEKPHVPVITLTPSTPTDNDHLQFYPAGRLPPPNARHYFCDDGSGELDFDNEIDTTLKPVSRWPRLLPVSMSTRTARISALLGFLGVVALVHFLVIRTLIPRDDELATDGAHF